MSGNAHSIFMTQTDLFTDPLDLRVAGVLGLEQRVAEGRALRDEGMKRVADHSDEAFAGWQDRTYQIFIDFARGRAEIGLPEFMTETCRAHARTYRLIEEPPDLRAWGAVAARARRNGFISAVRYAPQNDPKSHRSPKPVWRLC